MSEQENFKFMFDTNVFGDLLDGDIKELNVEVLQENEQRALFYITHIQRDELNAIRDKEFRTKLLNVMEEFSDKEISTSGFRLGISKLGKAKLGEGGDEILKKLPSGNKMNNAKDALIAKTAVSNDFTLVTADGEGRKRGLQDVLDELGYTDNYMSRSEFIGWLDNE